MISAPATSLSGSNVDLSWSITNQGTSATISSWKDKVYICDNATFEADLDRVFGEFEHRESLTVGETKEISINTNLREDIIGNKYVLIVSDADDNLIEAIGENNNVIANPIDITLAPYADLAVSNVTAPNLTIDDPAKVKVSWRVTNQGTGTGYSDTWVDRVIASKDGTVGNSDDLVIGEYTHTGFLAESEFYDRSENILLPPAFTGRYNLFIKTDAKTKVFENGLEENNVGGKDGFFDVMTIPYADLQITELDTTGAANSGQPITVNWTVTNDGIGLTNTSEWSDSLYLATDPQGKNIVADLGSFDRAGALAVGKNYNRSGQVILPECISGEHYIVAKTGGPFEFIYNNNNSLVSDPFNVTFTAPPDLTVTNIVAPEAITSVDIPQRATVGQSFNLSYTVTNQGTGNPTQTSWQDRVYLSRDKFLDLQSDRYLTSFGHSGGLNAGASYTVDQTVNLPTDLSGPYYVFVISDPASKGTKAEIFEGGLDFNNSRPSTQPLSLDFPPPADLQVEDIKVPNTALSGDNISLRWTVTNAGPNAAKGEWSDALYLSTDAIWDIEDRPLGKVKHNGIIEPGESYTQNLDTILPPAAPGQYRIIVRPDILNQVYETENEVNNCTASPNPLNVTVEELNLGVAKETTLSTGQSRLYQVEVGEGETLRVNVDSAVNNAMKSLSNKELFPQAQIMTMPTRAV